MDAPYQSRQGKGVDSSMNEYYFYDGKRPPVEQPLLDRPGSTVPPPGPPIHRTVDGLFPETVRRIGEYQEKHNDYSREFQEGLNGAVWGYIEEKEHATKEGQK